MSYVFKSTKLFARYILYIMILSIQDFVNIEFYKFVINVHRREISDYDIVPRRVLT